MDFHHIRGSHSCLALSRSQDERFAVSVRWLQTAFRSNRPSCQLFFVMLIPRVCQRTAVLALQYLSHKSVSMEEINTTRKILLLFNLQNLGT